MTNEQFRKLVAGIQCRWSDKEGLIALAYSADYTDGKVLRICVGTVNNTGIVASDCLVWLEEDMLYQGKLDDKALKKLLDSNHICHIEYTNYRRVGFSITDAECFGRKSSKCGSCTLR